MKTRMKNKLATLLVILCSTAAATCNATLSGMGNGYVILNPNGAGDTYYKVDSYNTSLNPPFSGNLGTIQYGQSLMLGGEIQTWPQQSGVTVTMHYAIDQSTSFSSMNLSWFQSGGGNDWWHAVDAVNIDNSLSAGTHTIYIWFSAFDGGTTVYDSNNGANFSANFTISAVPEPTNVALAGFAGMAVLAVGLRSMKSGFHSVA